MHPDKTSLYTGYHPTQGEGLTSGVGLCPTKVNRQPR
jgi:hypothetical protein